jgi:mycothiol synthase
MDLPAPYVARPYRGPPDHTAMASILGEYHQYSGSATLVTEEQISITYASLTNCDPATDVVVIESDDVGPIGYVRTSWEELEDGSRVYVLFAPMRPDHLAEPLFQAMVAAQEAHMRPLAKGFANAHFWAFAPHPGPGQAPTNEAAWLESLGYTAIRFEAHLVRPDLENIPELALPDGVELRAVTPEMIRPIWEAHSEAFRGSWDFHEETEVEIQRFIDDPLRDESLWKVAWVGDTIVGQVKSYINAEENAEMGYLRGYTEYISTHAEWRNKGIAGALLARSLQELKDRGMTEAALGADTQNPGGAFQLYTKLGFELRAYEVVYAKPLT